MNKLETAEYWLRGQWPDGVYERYLGDHEYLFMLHRSTSLLMFWLLVVESES